jgi:hypothetical protein
MGMLLAQEDELTALEKKKKRCRTALDRRAHKAEIKACKLRHAQFFVKEERFHAAAATGGGESVAVGVAHAEIERLLAARIPVGAAVEGWYKKGVTEVWVPGVVQAVLPNGWVVQYAGDTTEKMEKFTMSSKHFRLVLQPQLPAASASASSGSRNGAGSKRKFLAAAEAALPGLESAAEAVALAKRARTHGGPQHGVNNGSSDRDKSGCDVASASAIVHPRPVGEDNVSLFSKKHFCLVSQPQLPAAPASASGGSQNGAGGKLTFPAAAALPGPESATEAVALANRARLTLISRGGQRWLG